MSISEDPPQIQKTLDNEPESPTTKRGSKTRIPQSDIPFHGVRKRRWGRYVSEIRLPGKNTRIWLGSFGSPEMAARAHDAAAFYLKGNSAILNFPNSAGSLPRPESSSRRDIKLAAAKAALEQPEVEIHPVEVHHNNNSGTTEDDLQPDCSGWWGLVDGGFGTTSFEDVKDAPLLSPMRLDSMCGQLYSMELDMDMEMEMDDESLLASCFVL